MLPVSRNTSYGAEVPVKSADLNDIQDNIVGSKHAETEFPIATCDFAIQNNATPNFAAGSITLNDNTGVVSASVRRPVGTRITHVKFSLLRLAGTFTIVLRRRVLSGGGGGAPAAATDVATAAIAAGVGNLYSDLAAINHTIAAGFVYWIEVTADATATAAGAVVYGASIFADRL